jgi:hypothetical protein
MEDDAIEKKKKINDMITGPVSEIGNMPAFLKQMAWSMAALLVVSYIGSTVVSITQLTGAEIDDLFPTDLKSFPYQVPAGKSDGSSSIAELFDRFGTDNAEHLTRATLEYIYPLKRTSFPYKSWFLSKEFEGSLGFVVAKWFAMTCAGTFCAWRSLYKTLIVLGKWFYSVLHNYADFFLFYVYSYLAIYVILLPIIPVVGAVLAALSSTMYNIPGAWILTFAPIMGVLFAIANLFSGGMMNIYSWVISIIMVYAGYAAGFVNLAWWIGLGGALWVYTVVFLFLSPLLHVGGLQKMFEVFKGHMKSMLVIALVLIVMAAHENLSPALTVGFGIGAAICAVLIYKMKSPTE